MALEVGFAWSGATYRSLSEVARAITGTRWNGPRFFGLSREPKAEKDARWSAAAINQGFSPRKPRKMGPDGTPHMRALVLSQARDHPGCKRCEHLCAPDAC